MIAIKLRMKYVLTMAISLVVASCSVLPEREPTTIYETTHGTARTPSNAQPVSWSLVIAKPLAGQLLEDDGIVVRPAAGVVQVYKGASWSDPTPDLVQTSIVRAMEDSGRIVSVARPGATIQGDFQLVTELRAFESVYQSDLSVHAQIEIYAKLVRTSDGRAVAARSFRETEPSSSEAVEQVVEALSRVLERATGNIVEWTLKSGSEAGPSPTKP